MRYKVPVVWSMLGYITVEAESADDAANIVDDLRFDMSKFNIHQGEFLEDSLYVDGDAVLEVL